MLPMTILLTASDFFNHSEGQVVPEWMFDKLKRDLLSVLNVSQSAMHWPMREMLDKLAKFADECVRAAQRLYPSATQQDGYTVRIVFELNVRGHFASLYAWYRTMLDDCEMGCGQHQRIFQWQILP